MAPTAAVAAVAVAAGGCGGDRAASRGEVARAAEPACLRYAVQKRELLEGVTGPDAASAAAREAVAIRVRLIRALEGIEPGGAQRAGFERLVAAQRLLLAGERGAASRLESGDVSGVQQATARLDALEARARVAARAAGVCAPDERLAAQRRGTAPRLDPSTLTVIPGSGAVGTWSGSVVEYAPGRRPLRYPASMAIAASPTADGVSGTIDYPRIPCSGTVHIADAAGRPAAFAGFRNELRETILRNRSACSNGARIVAYQRDGELEWRWSDGHDVRVVGVLTHPGASPRARRRASLVAADEPLVDAWRGRVTRYEATGAVGTSDVELEIGLPRAGAPDGTISSTDPDCAGTLDLRAMKGARYVFRERVTRGPCADGATVGLLVDEDALSYQEAAADGGAPVLAFGELARVSAARPR